MLAVQSYTTSPHIDVIITIHFPPTNLRVLLALRVKFQGHISDHNFYASTQEWIKLRSWIYDFHFQLLRKHVTTLHMHSVGQFFPIIPFISTINVDGPWVWPQCSVYGTPPSFAVLHIEKQM